MALELNGTSQYAEVALAAISGSPCTLAVSGYITDATARQLVLAVYGLSGTNIIELVYEGPSSSGWYAYAQSGGATATRYRGARESAGISRAAAAWASGSSAPSLWVNGSSITGTSSAADIGSVSGLTRMGVGTDVYGGTRKYNGGKYAEVAVWNDVLSAAELEAVTSGFCPAMIRPASLVVYWPLGGLHPDDYADRRTGAYSLSATGSPSFVEHPRVIYPSEPKIMQASAASTTKYWLFANRNAAIIG